MNKMKTLSLLYAVAMTIMPSTAKANSSQQEAEHSDTPLVQNLMTKASLLYADSKVMTNYMDKAERLFLEKGVPFKNWQIRYEIRPEQEKLHCSLFLSTNEVPAYLSQVSPDFRPRIKVAPFKQMMWSGPKPKEPLPPRNLLSFDLISNQDGFEVSSWLKPSENDPYYILFKAGDGQPFLVPSLSKNKQNLSKPSDKEYYFNEYPGTSLRISQNSYPTNLTHISVSKNMYSPAEIKKDYWCLGTPKELMDKVVAQKSIVLTDAPKFPLGAGNLDFQISSSKSIKHQVENRLYHMERNAPIQYTELKYVVYGFEYGYDPSRTFVTYKVPTDKGETFRYFEVNQPQDMRKNQIGSFTEISPEEYDKKISQIKQNPWITLLSATRAIDGTTSIIIDGNNPKCRYNHYKKMSMSYNPKKSKKWNLVIIDVPHEHFGCSAEREIQMTFDGDSRISCKAHYPSAKEIRLFSDKKIHEQSRYSNERAD